MPRFLYKYTFALLLASCQPVPHRAGPGEACSANVRCGSWLSCLEGVCAVADAGQTDAPAEATLPDDALPPSNLDGAPPAPPPVDHRSPQIVGCSDRTREGFLDVARYPNLASCAGAWTRPGLWYGSDPPVCERTTGNTGRLGLGCSAEDLCAPGWHICLHLLDMKNSGFVNCEDAAADATSFFAMRQHGKDLMNDRGTICPSDDRTNYNNVFGCGLIGLPATHINCESLRMLALRPESPPDCMSYPPWDCGLDRNNELLSVMKAGSDRGGVICCKDMPAP